jgi:hypothetical protein
MMFRAAAVVLLAGSGLAHGEVIYGVTTDQTLVTFSSTSPGVITTGAPISGLLANETIRGLDFRPATGQLFALGSFSNLYTINPATGAASQVGGSFATPLNGSTFGFDFNPTIDRIRVVSDANQNLVLNPNTGALQLNATPLAFGAGDANFGQDPNVVGSAYDNNFVGATTSQLYGIDTRLDVLVRQGNNTGVLTTVGSLGGDITNLVGFDISGATGVAYAATQDASMGISTLWSINLATGAASPIGQIGGGTLIGAMTVVPAPGAIGLLLGVGMMGVRRRR